MPRGDGTGPAGMGPRTGRGFGYCNGYTAPGFMNGNGFARGRGFGRGFGFGYRGYAPGPAPQYYPGYNQQANTGAAGDQIEYLKQTAQSLERELKTVKDEINRLEDQDGE